MTPIQTHEAELRAMMERAGLAVNESRSFQIVAAGSGRMVALHMLGHYHECRMTDPEFPAREFIAGASHTDPRIALRHCLEMAGLLTDRPPQTDEELIAWLTERAGPADLMDRWFHGGYTIRQLDHVWVYWHQDRPLERSIYARELGAILAAIAAAPGKVKE